jgi:hypothetical protein
VSVTTIRAAVDKRVISLVTLSSPSSSMPAFATYCKSAAAYSSACSCAGVLGGTVMAPIPTVTVTATATSIPAPACPGADLTQDNNNCGACGNVVCPIHIRVMLLSKTNKNTVHASICLWPKPMCSPLQSTAAKPKGAPTALFLRRRLC